MFSNTGPLFGGMFVLAFLPFILNLILTIFGIYFVIKVTQFMNAKTKSDQVKNEKIDYLINVINQDKNTK